VQIVTGDTKVIERQAGGNIFINTSGIGVCIAEEPINPAQIQSGDAILISGDIGRHGMAVMAQRESLEFSDPLVSDCASLFPMVQALLEEGIAVRCLRDLTRGGLATALVELAESAKKEFAVEEEAVPVCQAVNSACEILGFDPLYVANEGRMVAFVPEEQAAKAVAIMQRYPEGALAAKVGHVASATKTPGAILVNPFGAERILYRLVGDQLPRIC
jgi:hydrogenase expression/formation protein HypE